MYSYQRILGDCVKTARQKIGMTQLQLAEQIHSNKRTIIDIEKYRGNPKLETLFDLLTFLEIDPYMIFYPKPPTRSEAMSQMKLLLQHYSEERIKRLIPICKSILEFADEAEKINATNNE